MKLIKLTQGMSTVVDDEDFEYLNQWKWYFLNNGYAVRKSGTRKNQKLIYIHREIMRPPPSMDIDHINRDRLDNRKENLRICTRRENIKNRGVIITKRGTSLYCKRGHLLTGVSRFGRYCKTCKNENARKRRLKNK